MRDTLRRGDEEIPNSVGGSYTVVSLTPEIGYRLPRGFAVRLRAPIHWKTFDETSPMVHREANGLGDVELVGSYEARFPAPWRLAASAGAALPTGEHEAQPFVGDLAPTPLQLGGGTFDPVAALVAEYRPNVRWGADARTAARLAVMENMHDYRPASLFEVGAGGQWRPWPRRLGLSLHVDWSHVTRVAVSGEEAPNTGRDTIYVEPAAAVVLWEGLSLEASARIPVYMRVNATQFAEAALFAVRLVYRTQPLF